MFTHNVKFISIEGNIGAGKSTLITRLQNYIDSVIAFYADRDENRSFQSRKIVFLKEPVEVWQSVTDDENANILELFYKNPGEWSFAFQVMVFTSQQKMIEDTLKTHPECRLIICERSVEAGRNIFTQLLVDKGKINTVENKIYSHLFESHKYPLYASIFLDISPEVCMSRIKTRAREGESNIDLSYLVNCDKYYRQWLIEKKELYSSPKNVYIIKDNELDSILPILVPLFQQIL